MVRHEVGSSRSVHSIAGVGPNSVCSPIQISGSSKRHWTSVWMLIAPSTSICIDWKENKARAAAAKDVLVAMVMVVVVVEISCCGGVLACEK